MRLAARITANLGAFWHLRGTPRRRAPVDRPRPRPRRGARRPSSPGSPWPQASSSGRAAAGRPRALGRGDRRLPALGDDRYLAYALGLVPGTYIGEPDRYDLAIGLCDEGIALARRSATGR